MLNALRVAVVNEELRKARTHKYIKRERKGDKWIYYYRTPEGKVVSSEKGKTSKTASQSQGHAALAKYIQANKNDYQIGYVKDFAAAWKDENWKTAEKHLRAMDTSLRDEVLDTVPEELWGKMGFERIGGAQKETVKPSSAHGDLVYSNKEIAVKALKHFTKPQNQSLLKTPDGRFMWTTNARSAAFEAEGYEHVGFGLSNKTLHETRTK